jgi:hypothetical protein
LQWQPIHPALIADLNDAYFTRTLI